MEKNSEITAPKVSMLFREILDRLRYTISYHLIEIKEWWSSNALEENKEISYFPIT